MAFPRLPGEDLINSWYPIIFALICGLLYGIRSYFRGAQCMSSERLTGKTVIVTGGNSGIGKELVKDFAKRGAKVVLACRDEEKGKAAVEDIKLSTKVDKIKIMKIDLSSLSSVRQFVEDLKEEENIDILINNAGVMCYPQAKTDDGLEYHFSVNYLGTFLLTHLLLPKLKACEKARIVNVTALAARLGQMDFEDLQFEQREYNASNAYSQSKLAVVLFTRRLAKELEGTNVTVNVAQPGVVNTDVHRHMPFRQSTFISVAFAPFIWLFMKGARDGAQTIIQCAVGKEEDGVSGKYYSDCAMVDMPEETWKDDEAADKLWNLSFKLAGLKALTDKESAK